MSELLAGMRNTTPLVIGAIPFGVIFGTLATVNGLSFQATIAMSVFVYAGSAQFIALGLLAGATAWPIIVATTFVVNLRHLLYAATLVPHVKNWSHLIRPPFAFWLTDETFAVVMNRWSEQKKPITTWYYFGSAFTMYLNWQLCTFIGLTAGRSFPNIAGWGLDFAMPVTFIGMLMPYLKSRVMWWVVLISGGVSVLAYALPHKLGLMLAAACGIAVGVLFEILVTRKGTR